MLLNEYSNKIDSNDTVLYPYNDVWLNPHQKSVLQLMGITERHTTVHCTESERLWNTKS